MHRCKDDPRSEDTATSSKNSTSSTSMRNLSQHQLQKPAALLNLSTYSQESEVNESMERQQYRSPQRCLRSTPTPAVSPLVSTYPLSRGHHRHMNGGAGGSSETSIMIRPFPSLDGSPLSLSSDSTQNSSWSEDLRTFRVVKKVLNLEEHQEPEPSAATTPMKPSELALGSDSELKLSKEASSLVSILSMTPSPTKKASSKHDTPDTGTTEPSDASSLANQSTITGLNTPVLPPFKNTLFCATVHQTEESDEVEIILGARSPVKSNLLDLHDQQQPASPKTPLGLHEHPSSPSRFLNLCGFSVNDWCSSNHCALAATCETACGNRYSASPGDDSTQQHMQSSICVSLGTMDGLCQPWQASYPPRSITPNKLMHHRHHTSKRRNLDLHKRRAHLNSIRRDLNPFTNLNTATTSESQRRPLSKSQSFNHYSSPPWKASKPKDGTAATTTTTTTELPLVWTCGGFSSANHNSPAAIRLQWEDECQDYDSDPEDYSPRRSNKENSNSTTLQTTNASTLEEFLNSRSTFILHEAGKSVAVHVWVELGQRLQNQTILPKLLWRPCRDSFKTPTERMDLLDICRIFPPSTGLDRTRYPFARTDRILQIHSVRGPVVTFEARSTSERDRWMTLSKLAVSVFAAQLLTNDPTALTLFFVDSEAAIGPGEEPTLWQQQPSKPREASSNAPHREAWI